MPNATGTTVTKAGDLNMGGYQGLKSPKKGKTPMFQADGAGGDLSGGVSTGHSGLTMPKAQKPVRTLRKAMTQSPEKLGERIKRLAR